jgi:outer membrane lipopolysaccharide assembly protein LptE/RlpB
MKKKLLYFFMLALVPVLTACGDGNDEPDGVYDWDVTKQLWAVHKTSTGGTRRTLTKSEDEVVKSKTEDQMRLYKLEYEAQSDDWWVYKYSYKQR